MADVGLGPSPIHGLGVFAERAFAAGEVILAIDDTRVVDDTHPLREELGEYDHHCDYLARGRVVLMPPPERHINSSCDPNSRVLWHGETRSVVARRAIGVGEEITYDYIIDTIAGDVLACRCGSEQCRATVPSSFFDLPLVVQGEYLPLLSPWFVDEYPREISALRRRLLAAR